MVCLSCGTSLAPYAVFTSRALHPTWQALDELLEQRPSGGSDEDSEQAADLLGAHGGVGYADAAKRCKLSDANDAFASSFFA